MSITIKELAGRKLSGPPIAMLTAYDYPTARTLDKAGIDILLVGDSVGTNILGYDSERSVTVADMEHHTRAVRRGTDHAFILVDMPYMSYDTVDMALETAKRLQDAGADGVKLEGLKPEIVEAITEWGLPVCGHLGLMPQTQTSRHVQGKTYLEARKLIEDCDSVEQAGAALLLLELVPREVAAAITQRISIPTIGIGSGPETTGQVLVVNDIVGITDRLIRHSARYAAFAEEMKKAALQYLGALRDRTFPTDLNSVSMNPEELQMLQEWLAFGKREQK